MIGGKIEIMQRVINTDADLKSLVDMIEGQIGTVLSVMGPKDERLYVAAVLPHEAGVM